MKGPDKKFLQKFAAKYIWWKTPEKALAYPARIVSQIMDIGDYDDVVELTKKVGDDYLKSIINNAEPGQFSSRSWTFWHYRLHLADLENIPPLPGRKVS